MQRNDENVDDELTNDPLTLLPRHMFDDDDDVKFVPTTPPSSPMLQQQSMLLNQIIQTSSSSSLLSLTPNRASISSSHRSPRNLITDEMCGYCAKSKLEIPYPHTKDNCPHLRALDPCHLCGATGAMNHTPTYCPHRQKKRLELKKHPKVSCRRLPMD